MNRMTQAKYIREVLEPKIKELEKEIEEIRAEIRARRLGGDWYGYND